MEIKNTAKEVFPNGGRARFHKWSRYVGRSGEVVEGPLELCESYKKIDEEESKKEIEFVRKLRELGIRAAHPDDGWHKREEGYFGLSYPYFNEGVEVGDMVALGNPERFVVVIVKKVNGFLSKRYYYQSSLFPNP